MKYGILKSATNTGLDSEIAVAFTAPLSVFSNQPSYVQDSVNLKRVTGKQGVQRWEIDAGLESTNNSAAFLNHSVEFGYADYFYIRMPQVYGIALSTSGSITVNGTFSANVNLINISGVANLNAGEFITFNNHEKVYLVLAGGSGGNNIKVSPPLLVTVPTGTGITVGGNVKMKCLYDNTVRLGISYVDGILANPGTIRLIEKI